MMALLCAVFSTAWGAEETIVFSEQGYENAQKIEEVNGTNFTITFDQGTNSNNAPKYYTTGSAIRVYAGNTFTVSSATNTITKIEISFASGEGSNAIIPNVGTYATGTWQGSASSVIFTIDGTSGHRRLSGIKVTYSSGSEAPSVAAPSFSVAGDTYYEPISVELSCATEGADIYYTTNGDTPDANSTKYTVAITISETTTLKAIAFKDDVYSAVASATYIINIITPVSGLNIDFESDAAAYTDWVFTNIVSKQTGDSEISAHGDSYFGVTGGTQTGSITTKDKIATPNILTCYVSKSSKNTTSSTWKIQVSSDGTTWKDVAERSAVDMTKGEWKEFTAELSDYTDVYVRVYYSGSTAVRALDDLTLTTDPLAPAVAKPVFTLAEGAYIGTQNVTITCETENAVIYYTTDGSNPTNDSNLYENPIEVATTTTIKAIAYLGDENSKIASATYTITPILTISQARNEDIGSTVTTSGVVTSLSSSNGNTTAYIQDETAAICIYGADANVNCSIGDEITVSGKLSTYKGLLEITNPSCTVISNNNSVSPVTKTILEINNDYDNGEGDNTLQGMLVRVEDATVTNIDGSNTTISQGENTIIVRDITGVEYAIGNVVSLTANIGCYNAAQLVHPTQIEVASETVTIGSTKYATLYYSNENLIVPANVTAMTYKASGEKIAVSKTYASGEVIPAGTAVVLEGTAAGAYKFFVTTVEGESDSDNNLYGLDEAGTTVAPGSGSYLFYKLSTNSAGAEVGFYFGAENGAAFNIPAHKAYLAIPGTYTTPGGASAFVFDETVGINTVQKEALSAEGIYTLSGIRVNGDNLTKGIYIVNGKKIVIK